MSDAGHIDLERSVDSIQIGVRQDRELGDLSALKRSIKDLGLLQPITITPDGTLLCGRRRLAAIKELGWPTVKVWVRSGISDTLHSLLAWQDENALHKPLSIIESADLYRELHTLIAEDALRRQRMTQFGADAAGGPAGAANLAGPSRPGDARRQAAETITGRASYTRLEMVNALQDLAADETESDTIRLLAESAIGQIRAGAPVTRTFGEVRNVRESANVTAADEDELERLAREALERIKQPRTRRSGSSPTPKRKRSTRAFVHIWTDMHGWSERYDADEVGPELTDTEWAQFERAIEEITDFHATALAARAHGGRGKPEPDAHLHLV